MVSFDSGMSSRNSSSSSFNNLSRSRPFIRFSSIQRLSEVSGSPLASTPLSIISWILSILSSRSPPSNKSLTSLSSSSSRSLISKSSFNPSIKSSMSSISSSAAGSVSPPVISPSAGSQSCLSRLQTKPGPHSASLVQRSPGGIGVTQIN